MPSAKPKNAMHKLQRVSKYLAAISEIFAARQIG